MKSRKELVQEYKALKPVMGVFQILNTVNGKQLIEASTDIASKINRHKLELRFGSHRNRSLQKDWKDSGESAFKFEVLSELSVKEGEEINFEQEIKLLKEMLLEELNIQKEMQY